jgi:DNA-binding NtrC family response regulator
MVRKIVRKMLERSGHKVVEAENGKLGIELLTSDAFDLVITDIIMPEMEGIETLINVKRQRPDTQVIAMSGGGRTGNVDFLQTAQKLGAAAILHKPFTMNSLSAAVEEACGKVLTAAAS